MKVEVFVSSCKLYDEIKSLARWVVLFNNFPWSTTKVGWWVALTKGRYCGMGVHVMHDVFNRENSKISLMLSSSMMSVQEQMSCHVPKVCGVFTARKILTHRGLVTPFADIYLSQHWLRQWLVAWRHQAITWTNVDLSSVRSSGIHLRAISWEMPQPPFTKVSLKMTYLKLNWKLPGANELTHWGRVTHICVSKLTIIGSDNGLSPERRQAIIWNNAGILLIGPLETNFNEILIGIQTFSFKKMHFKMSSAKWRPFCLGLNVLRTNNAERVTMGRHYHATWCIQLRHNHSDIWA